MMRKILLGIGVLTILAGVIWAARQWNIYQVNARTANFNEDVDNLFAALQKYKERVGSYPIGPNAEVAKALQGSNSKNVIVIVGSKTKLNDKGEFIDPWQTPLRIYFSGEGILIRSAGANRRFDDSTVAEMDDFIRSN